MTLTSSHAAATAGPALDDEGSFELFLRTLGQLVETHYSVPDPARSGRNLSPLMVFINEDDTALPRIALTPYPASAMINCVSVDSSQFDPDLHDRLRELCSDLCPFELGDIRVHEDEELALCIDFTDPILLCRMVEDFTAANPHLTPSAHEFRQIGEAMIKELAALEALEACGRSQKKAAQTAPAAVKG
jgi:hypothetical protein